MELKEKIRFFALENATRYGGKANPGAIIGKLLSDDPTLKEKLKDLQPTIQAAIKEVNALSVAQQQKELEKAPEDLFEKKEPEERDIFAFLKIDGAVNTAFPPGPEKYPHIGHAKALLLNYLLAEKTGGDFILRFEDTNPDLVHKEFYDIMQENFTWLGVKWKKLIYASDFMQDYYDKALMLIEKGEAYMCFCDTENIRDGRMKKVGCACREKSTEEHLASWKEFPQMTAGEAILRLKIDLAHKNTTMRDPTIFRIIDTPHPRIGSIYRVWPNYDFQNAILDSLNGIDIRLRSKEFEMRNELQRFIQERLGLRVTRTYEFARFNLEGVLSSGRVIREKVNSGELIGWDDPTLTTLVALRRRGFLPEAIKNFVISTGITKAESTLTWDDLILHNKRLLDETAKRFFLIRDPLSIEVGNAPKQNIELNLNPNTKEGGRKHSTDSSFIIEKSDAHRITEGSLVRLMDCLNFRKEKDKFIFDSTSFEDYKGRGNIIIHWLAQHESSVNVEILMPDKSIVKGVAEKGIENLKIGDVIQFERFGFVRFDAKEKKCYSFWFTHA